MTDDPYTMEVRLCDDGGLVSDTPVEPGSPGTASSPDLTYLKLHNNLRARNSNPDTRKPTEQGGWQCTGHAHLAGEHIRCTNPIHDAPRYSPGTDRVVVANTGVDWTQPGFDWPLPPVTKLKAALAGYDAQWATDGGSTRLSPLPLHRLAARKRLG